MKEQKTNAQIKTSQQRFRNKLGTIAMARTNVVDSATSQFFINVKDNDFLIIAVPRRRSFATRSSSVIEGMNVVHNIEKFAPAIAALTKMCAVEAVVIIR